MKKAILLSTIFTVCIMLMLPSIIAVENNADINSTIDKKIGFGFAMGKVDEFYENDTEYVINWKLEGAFIFQWDNIDGFYIGLNDMAGVIHYPKDDFTFIGITTINFLMILCLCHEF